MQKVEQEKFHPSEFIKDELKERDWTTGMFAARMGINHQDAANLVGGKTCITLEIAEKLGRVFDNSVQSWLNVQSVWDRQDI